MLAGGGCLPVAAAPVEGFFRPVLVFGAPEVLEPADEAEDFEILVADFEEATLPVVPAGLVVVDLEAGAVVGREGALVLVEAALPERREDAIFM